jgi:FlaA1/EpsC-like NDP-sugar epimerase
MTINHNHIRVRSLQVLGLACLAGLSLAASFELRFEFAIPADVLPLLWVGLLAAIPVKVGLFYLGRFHRSLRMYAETGDVFRLLVRNALASVFFALCMRVVTHGSFPRSVYLIDFLMSSMSMVVVWFSTGLSRLGWWHHEVGRKRILIYGAGWAGATLLKEIRANRRLGLEVTGFLDDDPAKQGGDIMGVPVLGSGADAKTVVARLDRKRRAVEEIVIAIPSASGQEKRRALGHCQAAKIRCRTIPGIADLLEREVLVAQIRDLSVTDLLGRPPVQLDEGPVTAQIAGRSVLITGAAGSIGSELCRQVANMRPGKLVVFDQAESDLFRIQNELRDKHPNLDLVVALGDIRNSRRVAEVLDRNGIDSVFHAAAYKHVPMMESHLLEAVQNNVLGTWNLMQAVRQRRIPRFLMISSDKAVNPTNIMGATKRACELLVAAAPPSGGGTKCVSVRFGNVLGSNGSVVPIFRAQIAAGGPVRVTHPEVTRYFMSTAEAVSLVLQASSMGTNSELFVLDMGEPIRIVDLAVNMIRLAGLVPYEDVDIEFTGLRPGEKLYEEISCPDELTRPTYHEKIRIFQQTQPEWLAMVEWVERLRVLLDQRSEDAVLAHLRYLVPEYHPTGNGVEQATAALAAGAAVMVDAQAVAPVGAML